MSREREVKLRIPDAAHFTRVLETLPRLGEKQQRNVYFDTPGLDLSRSGILVRVREGGGRVLLTVKRGARRAPGRIESEEWETDLAPALWEAVLQGSASLPEAARFEPLDAAAAGRPLAIVGTLENHRWECEGPDGSRYELDETRFPWGEIHHEVEIESEDPVGALERARRFLDAMGVVYDTTVETKHERLLRGPRR